MLGLPARAGSVIVDAGPRRQVGSVSRRTPAVLWFEDFHERKLIRRVRERTAVERMQHDEWHIRGETDQVGAQSQVALAMHGAGKQTCLERAGADLEAVGDNDRIGIQERAVVP